MWLTHLCLISSKERQEQTQQNDKTISQGKMHESIKELYRSLKMC